MKLRTPTHEEIKWHHFNIEHNGFYRDLNARLTKEISSGDERIVILKSLWPGVQDIASHCMRRVMSDLSGAGNAALAMVAVRKSPAKKTRKTRCYHSFTTIFTGVDEWHQKCGKCGEEKP